MSLNNHGLGFAIEALQRPIDPYRHLGSLGVFLRMQEGLHRAVDQQRRLFGPALDMHRQIERLTAPLGPVFEVHRRAIEGIAGASALGVGVPAHLELISQLARPIVPPFPTLMLTPLTDQLHQLTELVERVAGPFLRLERIVRGMRRGLCSRKLEAVHAGDVETLKLFTIMLGLPSDHWAAVAETLWEQHWLREWVDNPIAYIRKVAKRRHWRAREPRKSALYRNMEREALPEEGLGLLDQRWSQPFRLVELQWDYGIEDLTVEELVLAEARMSGVTRAAAPEILGWTVRDVARVWQALNRRRQRRR